MWLRPELLSPSFRPVRTFRSTTPREAPTCMTHQPLESSKPPPWSVWKRCLALKSTMTLSQTFIVSRNHQWKRAQLQKRPTTASQPRCWRTWSTKSSCKWELQGRQSQTWWKKPLRFFSTQPPLVLRGEFVLWYITSWYTSSSAWLDLHAWWTMARHVEKLFKTAKLRKPLAWRWSATTKSLL